MSFQTTQHCTTLFTSKSLSNMEQWYSNTEPEALGILHGLEKFHYYFTEKVNIITDQKPLVAMFNKDIITPSHWLQYTGNRLCSYAAYSSVKCVHIKHTWTRPVHSRLATPSWSHWKVGQEIAGMNISIHTLNTPIDMLVCILIEDIRTAMSIDAELQILQAHVIKRWPQNKDDLEPSLGRYWSIRHDLAMINDVSMKGKNNPALFIKEADT